MVAAPPARRFRLDPARSAVVIEARSNVGPILFATEGVVGTIDAAVDGGVLDPSSASAHLELPVDKLASGNHLYDSELQRRIDARRYPWSIVDLRAAEPLAGVDRFRVEGDILFHGVTRTLTGEVAVIQPEDGRIVVTGEEDVDIRTFQMTPPTMLMLKIEPEVRVRLHAEAHAEPLTAP